MSEWNFWKQVTALTGTGEVTLSGAAVGTAARRAPVVRADGTPTKLGVNCEMIVCTYWYDSMAAYDGNGGSFDLRLDATEGEAYAVSVELPATQVRQSGILYRTNPGTAVHLTFYYPAAAGGADVFEPLLGGPLGDWTPTPSGDRKSTR